MEFNITYEGQHSLEQVAKDFESRLSQKRIRQLTAKTLNETGTKVQGHIRKEIRKDYTITSKYLQRMSYLRTKATENSLNAFVYFSYRQIPYIGFKTSRPSTNKKGIVTMEIKKGNSFTLRHAFFATMRSGHLGIWALGKYVKGKMIYVKEKSSTGKYRLAEFKSASPFTMATSIPLQQKINDYHDKETPARMRRLLEYECTKMVSKV